MRKFNHERQCLSRYTNQGRLEYESGALSPRQPTPSEAHLIDEQLTQRRLFN
jgi:hypothetical protein